MHRFSTWVVLILGSCNCKGAHACVKRAVAVAEVLMRASRGQLQLQRCSCMCQESNSSCTGAHAPIKRAVAVAGVLMRASRG